MSFIEKKVNQVLNWENIELSVREMADVIQKELLELCSDKDLTELEKGINKGWILGVGAPNRYYPSAYQDTKLRLKYNILLHTIQEITLQDSKNKKEYFVPRGKKYCDQLRRTVLRRIENERERRKNPSRNSVQRESGDNSPHFDAVLSRHQSTSRLMRCRNCGSELSGNALFCSSCGQSTLQERPKKTSTVSGKKGKYRRKKRSRIKPVLCVVGVVVLCVGILGIGLSLIHFPELGANTDEIAVVQNGYLGEYTDFSVKEILGSYYGMLYEKEEWDSGTTDSGAQIVQARYYDEGMEEDATTIQFTMLNEGCFKISAFVDPLNPVEKATDMLAAMNYNYVLAYVAENQSVVGDPLAENGFIARISKISASAVQYGASADYGGNRATICELDGQTPLDVSVAMLLDNYGLLDMSYYWEGDMLEQTFVEPSDTVPTMEVPSEVEHDAESMLFAVLKGERTFIMSGTHEDVTIDGVMRIGDNEFDAPLIPFQYAHADMDQDGQQEAIVELDYGWRIILRYEDDVVYGYGYGFRGLQRISTNGLAMGSSGAAYSDIFRLHFNGGDVREEYLSSFESESAMENWIDIEWYDYGEIFSSSDTSVGTSAEYPLDLVNGNTGDVVNALGEEYIYGGGYSGSKLFYYGSQPDIQYGFVPHNWEEPFLTGSEPITIIILSGDAQINTYLSADMNKAELDTVAWETPDVQNVSNGNDYTMMSGSTYGYKIETSSAIIMYTWYLDNGDSIDYAASEIIIVPKTK